MSKNFELVEQPQNERVILPDSIESAGVPLKASKINNAGSKLWSNDEALRLVQQIFLLQAQEPPRVVVLAGVNHGSGCSLICASVAEILAQSAQRPVCLLEANFRSPALSEVFGITNRHGLTDALLTKGPITSFATIIGKENLWLLSSGTLARDSPQLLASRHLRERVEELRQICEFVIIDAPPLSRYSDALVLGQLGDGLVLILEAESTRRDEASVAVASVRSAQVPILAAVLNKQTFPVPERLYSRI